MFYETITVFKTHIRNAGRTRTTRAGVTQINNATAYKSIWKKKKNDILDVRNEMRDNGVLYTRAGIMFLTEN